MVLFLFLLAGVSARLLGLVQLSQHGERTPLSQAEWSHPETQPAGHLTANGISQQERHGSALQANYSDLFADVYNPERIYARAVDGPSTVASLRLQLKGAYGDSDFNLEVVSRENDTLLLPFLSCKRIPHIMNRDLIPDGKNMELMDMLIEKQEFLLPLVPQIELWSVYNASEIAVNYVERGLQLPAGEDIVELLDLVYSHVNFNLYYGDKQQVKLGITPLLLEIFSRFRFILAGENVPVVSLYMGEDVSLVPFLRNFEIKEIPKSGTFLQIELHGEQEEGETNAFVRFRHNGREVSLSRCPAPCAFSSFEQAWERQMYRSEEKWHERCLMLEAEKPWQWKKYALFAAFALGALALMKLKSMAVQKVAKAFKGKVD